MTGRMHSFADGTALAAALATAVAETLTAAIAARGTASLVVSGGTTPKAFFAALSGKAIAWDKVWVTLVDERFVPADSERSNHRLVAECLLRGPAAAARFLPLYHPEPTAAAAAKAASATASVLPAPFDVVVLGMGTDGHTASFFPGGSNLARALDPATPRGVIDMEAPGAGEPRLTFTFSALHDARLLVLHIEGAGKKAVLEAARGPGAEAEMPIRAVLTRAASPLEIYWAP